MNDNQMKIMQKINAASSMWPEDLMEFMKTENIDVEVFDALWEGGYLTGSPFLISLTPAGTDALFHQQQFQRKENRKKPEAKVSLLTATLQRTEEGDEGTFGRFMVKKPLENGDNNMHMAWALELPWRDNERNISRIPAGTYECRWRESPRFGWCYELLNVPDRSNILIHHGNWAGDTQKGKISNSAGCILLGKKKTTLSNQKAVSDSKDAITQFHAFTDKQPFILTITDEF